MSGKNHKYDFFLLFLAFKFKNHLSSCWYVSSFNKLNYSNTFLVCLKSFWWKNKDFRKISYDFTPKK